MSKTGVIGFPRRRVDGRAMTTGQTKYADDVSLPRMVFAKLLRSPVPHARIASVDTARATAHPGVLLVLTGRDLPIPYGILPVTQDEHALAIDKVRFVGDPVALQIPFGNAIIVVILARDTPAKAIQVTQSFGGLYFKHAEKLLHFDHGGAAVSTYIAEAPWEKLPSFIDCIPPVAVANGARDLLPS